MATREPLANLRRGQGLAQRKRYQVVNPFLDPAPRRRGAARRRRRPNSAFAGASIARGGLRVAGFLALAAAALPAPATAIGPKAVGELQRSSCPEYQQVYEEVYSDREQADALEGEFSLLGRPTVLRPPVDWEQDPHDSQAWRSQLLNLHWLDVLFYAYRANGSIPALKQARDLALDFARQNRRSGTGLVWRDKLVGDRPGPLAYAARAAACEDLLSDEKARRLLESIETHGKFLYEDVNYKPTNHGLFQDLGLILAAKYLPFLPEAGDWKRKALSRFERTTGRTVGREGLHQEHSPGYHFLVLHLVERAIEYTSGIDATLEPLAERMRSVAGWLVAPDGSVVQFGDTSYQEAPGFARQAAAAQHGTSRTRGAGFAAVREAGSYFATIAAHHSRTHKHADELSFDLFEDGAHVVADTGRSGSGYEGSSGADESAREFARSARAHSSLLVDGQGFEPPDDSFYGSAITATGRGDGWYAVQGKNPLVRPQGASHRRVFLYKPGTALVIVDDVASDEPHVYTRYVQLGRDVDPTGPDRSLELQAGTFTGSLTDMRTSKDRSRKVVRGQEDPLLGWYDKGGWAGFLPRSTVVYRSKARAVEHAVALGLGDTAPFEVDVTGSETDRTKVVVDPPTGPVFELTARRDGRAITVAEAAR